MPRSRRTHARRAHAMIVVLIGATVLIGAPATAIGGTQSEYVVVAERGAAATDVVQAIRAAGGVPVLAHFSEAPSQMPLLRELAGIGLAGLEVYYRTFDAETVWCRKNDSRTSGAFERSSITTNEASRTADSVKKPIVVAEPQPAVSALTIA